jgi:hypothetical protein
MPRDPKSRDITLNSLALITGGLTAVAFVGTGWVTGLAADYTAQKAQAKALTTAVAAAAPVTADPAPQPAATPRPTRTVVTTRVVQATSPVARQQVFTRSSGRVSTVRANTRFVAAPAPAPQRSRPRAVAPAPSAAS